MGWLTILKTMPWSQVIGNAPVVAEGARKLWNAVGNKPPVAQPAAAPMPAAGDPSATAQALAALERRMVAVESTADELRGQMQTSSELIKALAEQNAELVRSLEAQRVRLGWLTVAAALAGLAALGSLLLLLARGAA